MSGEMVRAIDGAADLTESERGYLLVCKADGSDVATALLRENKYTQDQQRIALKLREWMLRLRARLAAKRRTA